MITIEEVRATNPTIFGAQFLVSWIQGWQQGVIGGRDFPDIGYGPIRPTRKVKRITFSPTRLLDHLGKTIQVVKINNRSRRVQGRTEPIRLRAPERMLSQLEKFRQVNLGELQRLYTDAQRELERLLAKSISQAVRAEPDTQADLESGRMEQSLILSAAAQLLITNQIVLFVHHKYGVESETGVGWWQGRALEQALYFQLLPPREKWNRKAREAFEQLEFELPLESGGFAVPTPGGLDISAGGRRAPQSPSTSSKVDPARLAFYLSLQNFVEFRFLHGPLNRYGYLAVVLSGDRVLLDTQLRENAIRGLSGGPLAKLLEIAQGTKQEIDNSGFCPFWRSHDAQGNWRRKVRDWAK